MSKQGQSEKATPQRLKKAREQGRFVSSRELISSLEFLAAVYAINHYGPGWFLRLRGRTVRELAAGSAACLVLRPEHLRLVAPSEGSLRGIAGHAAFLGESVALDVTLETGLDVTVSLPARAAHPALDAPVGLRWDESACVVVPA